jgi:hypothetical protein
MIKKIFEFIKENGTDIIIGFGIIVAVALLTPLLIFLLRLFWNFAFSPLPPITTL